MTKKRKKIIITGGHLTPALAVIDELHEKQSSWELVFLGRKETMEGERDVSREKEAVESKGVRFLPITTGRLQRVFTIQSFVSLCKIPVGFAQALFYCLNERPQGVLSFGGYIALPVVIAAWILRVPVVTHEQTSVPGLANRIIAFFAKKVCVTFETTKTLFPKNKTVFTGLPVRKELLAPIAKSSFIVDEKKYPIIYITGGSTGSVSLNSLIFPFIGKLTQRFTVIHQLGRLSYPRGKQTKQGLDATCQKRYIIADYFRLSQLAWIMQHATLVVGRSGANTVMEIAMLGKMAFFIPLPWSGAGEQIQNARWLEKNGSARVMLQQYANTSSLLDGIYEMMRNKHVFESAAKTLVPHIPTDAAVRIVDQLEMSLQ